MADFLNDPAFPDRPVHPDFWRISSAVLKLDGQSQVADWEAIVTPLVDPRSLLYMAQNRVRTPNDPLVLPSAAWIDGFLAGAVYQQEGGHREE